jgi:hypothetical protein
VLAVVIWVCSARGCFSPDTRYWGRPLVTAQQNAILHGQLTNQRAKLRRANPEWDFMARTFTALALVDHQLAPSRSSKLHGAMALDKLIDSTLAEADAGGDQHFMLDYLSDGKFLDPNARSLFIDGEIALMLAARRFGPNADARYNAELELRIARIVAQLEAAPVLSGESYPDECWTFCNTLALAAIRLYDVAEGKDHSLLLARWVRMAKARLIDPATGLLVSSFHYDGRHLDGPEGSTLWIAAHNLMLVDPRFAREQYTLSKRALARSFVGFGWAREWPIVSRRAHEDIDSGPVIPGFELSPSSSGLALVAAGAFEDREYARELARSLDFAGFPVRRRQELHFAAGNQLADAVLAYGFAPHYLWKRVGAPAGAAR